jgi:homoserine trans-succinylase
MIRLREAQLCHAEHFLNVVSKSYRLYLKGGESAQAAFRLFESEFENIQKAQRWAASAIYELSNWLQWQLARTSGLSPSN